MVFSGKRIERDGNVYYEFPDGKQLPDALEEMICFAVMQKEEGQLVFRVEGAEYTIQAEEAGNRETVPETYAQEETCHMKIVVKSPQIYFDNGKLVYEPEDGEALEETIMTMLETANRLGLDIVAGFDRSLNVIPGDEFDTVNGEYLLNVLSRDKSWSNTPEVQEYLERKKDQVRQQEYEFRRLMHELPDFKKLHEIIPWLDAVGRCLNENQPGRKIVEVFAENGYFPHEYCDDNFVKTDETIHGRWVVGQFLGQIDESGYVCRPMYDFAKDWRKMFADKKSE